MTEKRRMGARALVMRPPAERVPYEPPKLTEFGTLQELTRGGSGKRKDFPLAGTKAH